jgi:hypothetical protein
MGSPLVVDLDRELAHLWPDGEIWMVRKKIYNHPYKEVFLYLVIRKNLLKEQVIKLETHLYL